jgi:hypothetical protein
VSSSSDDKALRFEHQFEREAFRLETLDYYENPASEDALAAFLTGKPQPPDYQHSSWVGTVRTATAEGKRIYRVHVLARPLTSYLQFELDWGYHRNQAAGEEFFILDITEQPNPLEGVPDFWLFDEREVSVMHYDPGGAFARSEELTGTHVGEFVGYRDTALAHAEPFDDWWTKYGG